MPLAVFILFMCPLFLTEICRALLDAGLTCFTTLALVFAHLARKRPACWLAVAVLCVLGALQKIPLILLVWILILFVRLVAKEERAALRSGWLLASLVLAVAGILVWPLWQVIEFGMPPGRIFGMREAFELAGPARLGRRWYFEIPFRLMTTWPCGLCALLAAFYFIRERRSHRALAEMAIISLTIITLGILFNFRSARYVVPILPALALGLAAFVHLLLEEKRRAATTLAVVVLFLSAVGLEVSRQFINYRRQEDTAQLRVAEALGGQQNRATQLVIVNPDKHVQPEQFFLFYGNLRFPVMKVFAADLPRCAIRIPAAGVCAARDLPLAQEKFPKLTIALRSGDFVCWRAP